MYEDENKTDIDKIYLGRSSVSLRNRVASGFKFQKIVT